MELIVKQHLLPSAYQIQAVDNKMDKNSWLDLPIDVWRTILDYLSFSKPSSLAILCMTCKFFDKLMPDQTFWKNMYSKRYGIEIAEIYQTKRQRQCKTWKQKFGYQFTIEMNIVINNQKNLAKCTVLSLETQSDKRLSTLRLLTGFGPKLFFGACPPQGTEIFFRSPSLLKTILSFVIIGNILKVFEIQESSASKINFHGTPISHCLCYLSDNFVIHESSNLVQHK